MGRGFAVGALAATVLALSVPVTAEAVDTAPGYGAKRCTSHSLRLTGPHRAKVGDAVTYRVTDRHHHPARSARYRALGVHGTVPVDERGRFTVQFSGVQIYRLVAQRGADCSNVLVVHVHR